MNERVLVIAPHPDDEVIGCGGSMLLHVKRGDIVQSVFLTSGEHGLSHLTIEESRGIRESEALHASQMMGTLSPVFLRGPDWEIRYHQAVVAEGLAVVIAKLQPTLIYLPHRLEDHPDHAVCFDILTLAMQLAQGQKVRCLLYEVWSPMPTWGTLTDITDVVDLKVEVLRCYISQLDDRDYIRATLGLASYRSAMNKVGSFAEAHGVINL